MIGNVQEAILKLCSLINFVQSNAIYLHSCFKKLLIKYFFNLTSFSPELLLFSTASKVFKLLRVKWRRVTISVHSTYTGIRQPPNITAIQFLWSLVLIFPTPFYWGALCTSDRSCRARKLNLCLHDIMFKFSGKLFSYLVLSQFYSTTIFSAWYMSINMRLHGSWLSYPVRWILGSVRWFQACDNVWEWT